MCRCNPYAYATCDLGTFLDSIVEHDHVCLCHGEALAFGCCSCCSPYADATRDLGMLARWHVLGTHWARWQCRGTFERRGTRASARNPHNARRPMPTLFPQSHYNDRDGPTREPGNPPPILPAQPPLSRPLLPSLGEADNDIVLSLYL